MAVAERAGAKGKTGSEAEWEESMKIREIARELGARVLTPDGNLDQEVHTACGSDMMSDVLAYVKDQAVLVTGLNNPQVVRTADMMADEIDTINYELICMFGARLPRIYV